MCAHAQVDSHKTVYCFSSSFFIICVGYYVVSNDRMIMNHLEVRSSSYSGVNRTIIIRKSSDLFSNNFWYSSTHGRFVHTTLQFAHKMADDLLGGRNVDGCTIYYSEILCIIIYKSRRRPRWTGDRASMEETRNAYRILVEKPLGKRLL